uniref:Uncharacterized protein n=1 Tax=Nymphaea colorata TaxID=210225 RepID=A0A5K1HDC1_9MAGN|nr:unnamed protein product [Nymphaea colorata]
MDQDHSHQLHHPIPMLMPGQILWPAPNDITSKSVPFTSMCSYLDPDMNLSGWNSTGLVHMLGSKLVAQTLTKRRTPLGGMW